MLPSIKVTNKYRCKQIINIFNILTFNYFKYKENREETHSILKNTLKTQLATTTDISLNVSYY
jgi:hypothetical protein